MVSKNKLNYFGFLALAIVTAAIVMVLTACSDDSDSENKGTETLTLSGQVHEREINEGLRGAMGLLISGDLDPTAMAGLTGLLSGELITYNAISGNMDISDGGMGGSGKIENGNLSYSIKQKPADDKFVSAADRIDALMSGFLSADGLPGMSGIYTDLTISPDSTQAAPLVLEINNDSYSRLIDRELIQNTFGLQTMSLTISVEGVNYVYVDRNATVTATGTGTPIEISISDLPIMGIPELMPELPITELPDIPVKLTLSDINLNLKKGWNVLGAKVTVTVIVSVTLIGSPEVTIGGINTKVDYSCQEPSKVPASFKWVANTPGIVPFAQ